MELLNAHTEEALKTCERVFVNELDSADDISSQIPLVKWESSQQTPGAFALYLLHFSTFHRMSLLFLEEMISQWFLPAEELRILSLQNLSFNIPRYKRPLCFIELLVHVPDEKSMHAIKDQLHTFIQEIQLGLMSVGQAKHILEMKRMSLGSKTSFIFETMFAFMRRFPNRFGHDILREVQHFLVPCREEFRKLRDVRHLCRVIRAHYLFQKAIELDVKAHPDQRHLYLKLMPTKLYYPFGLKKVVSLTIVLNRLGDYESFEMRHILSAIQRIIPAAQARKDSFCSHQGEQENLRTFYLEIEKSDESDFSLAELKQLSKELTLELKNNIEHLAPSLFIPRNEEELIHTIIHLSNALRVIRDVPQVTICFQEQQFDVLKFTVVLLRVLNPGIEPESLQKLSKHLPAKVRFIPERVATVGHLRQKYPKEANVFSLEVDNQLFLRKNHSVDLVKARQFVVKALEKMIGPFCDHDAVFLPARRVAAACDAQNDQQQILRLHLPRAAQSLDPRIGADRTSGIVIKMLYEGLCRINEKQEVELALAQEVNISEDQKKYIFTLKESFWSNGSPLTAYDFEYAWKKILAPDFRSSYSFLFFPIKNASAVKRGEKPMSQVGIQALNDKTLSIQLEHPTPFFLDLTSHWLFSPLCREIDQKHPGWAYHSGETHVSNGPFMLAQWKLNDDLQIVKNPYYWDVAHVKLDQIHISIIDDDNKALSLFYRDELDWIGDPLSKVPLPEISHFRKKGQLFDDRENYGLFWLQMNLNTAPFKNSKIRKAFAYGTNRQELIDNVLESQDVPAFGFYYTNQSPHLPLFKDGDTKMAKRLFEEGLDELKISLKEFPPILFAHSEIEEQVSLAYALGAQWKALFGVEVKYEKHLWNTYFDALNRNECMIGGIVWYTRFTDPIYFYNLLVYKEHAVKVTTWKDATYQKVVEEAKKTLDEKAKEKLLLEAETILLDAMPVIPLFYQNFRYIKNPRLKGYILSNTGQVDFRSAYLQKEEK